MRSVYKMGLVLCLSCGALPASVFAQTGGIAKNAGSSAVDREDLAAARSLSLLEKQPRLGTALDKVYGHHIERGTLDDFVSNLAEQTQLPARSGTAWAVLGLVELQRGRDADAATAFRQAEPLRRDDPLMPYYLGRALLLVGRPEEAAEAYSRALDRRPVKVDFLEIAQALGRLHQRAQRTDAALKVWDRLEQTFPGDERVREQIAAILAEEGDFVGGLSRFEALAKSATDPYRRVQFQLKVGELKLKLGRNPEALKDLEALLGQLKPDSWLHRDVRTKIDETFLRTDDFDGLSKYYESWLAKHPDDLDAVARYGKVLGQQERYPEAEQLYRRALKAAPSHKSLRRSLLDLLVKAERVPDALKEYAELDRLEPNHPDILRAWGSLILEDKSQPDAAKRMAAVAVWKRLLAARRKDPVIVSQVADLLRQAKLSDEAIELYRQAAALAPNDPQYREYLGEYLHTLDRRDAAVAVWKEIATGDKRTTRNLVRLAEVYRGFGYREQSVAAMGDACSLDPEFADILRYADLLHDAAGYDKALEQLERAQQLAENDDEREQILAQKIKTYVDSGRLAEEITALEQAARSRGTAAQWRTLAQYYDAGRRPVDAGSAITKSLERDAESLSTWMVAARIYETTGQLAQAVTANEKLATLDRRARSDYLERIANLNVRLGRTDAALKVGQDVVAAAPGKPEAYQFYAQLCFSLGRRNEGLDALRRAVRVNPADAASLLGLAAALAEQFRTEEAIELYWRAFDGAEDLDGRNAVVTSLSDLYLRTNQFDRLIAKLERIGQEQKQERESVCWQATAHQAGGDVGAARQVLEGLLSDDSKDTQLLQQLVRLAELEYDLEAALAYQRRIQELSPSRESQQQLASLLLRAGNAAAAEEILLDLAAADKQPHKTYDAIDEMFRHGRFDAGLKLCDKLLRDHPDDWEALYRSGVALWKTSQQEAALARFDRLRTLKIPEDQLSAKAEFQKAQKRPAPAAAATAASLSMNRLASLPAFLRTSSISYQLMQTFDDSAANRNYNSQSVQLWTPAEFGQVLLLAPGVRFIKRAAAGEAAKAFAEIQATVDKSDADPQELWDAVGLATLAQRYLAQSGPADQSQTLMSKAALKLAEGGDIDGKLMYLTTLRSLQQRQAVRNGRVVLQEPAPLDEAELDRVLAYYRAALAAYPEVLEIYGLTAMVINILKVGKREAQADEMYRELKAQADSGNALQQAFQVALALNQTDDMLDLAEKLELAPSARQMQYPGYLFSLWTQIGNAVAQAKDWPRLHTVVGRALSVRSRQLAANPSHQSLHRTTSSSMSSTGQYYVQVGGPTTGYRSVQLDYPVPNVYFDEGAIQFLYAVFDAHKPAQQVDSLLAYLSSQGSQLEGPDRLLFQLAATYVAWWNGDQQSAIAGLTAAVQQTPGDIALRLQLAGILLRQNRAADALETLDAFEPTDHITLRDRELLAVQAAIAVGHIERARTGAERLYGLQLDAGVQFSLAQLMHQLGMHEPAENLLGRMRRRSGNQTGTLVQVMQQYAAQGNSDVAAQMAHQLLRRSQPNPGQGRNRGVTEDMAARQQALQVLQRTGQLAKSIARVESQLERSPNSVLLLQTLAEYLQAAGQTEMANEVLGRLTKEQPNDGKALYRIAEQLAAAGKHSEACDAYLKAIAKDPLQLEDRYYNIRSTFQSAKRIPELAKAFETIDLKPLRQISYRLTDIVSEMVRSDSTREAGMSLFRRAWKELPDQRMQLMSRIYDDKLWATDEMYNYAREAVIPQNGVVTNPWGGVAETLSWNSDGKVTSLLTRLVQATKPPERRDQLSIEIAAALEKTEKGAATWPAGGAILAVLEAHAGKAESAGKRIETLLKDESLPSDVAMVVGQELGEMESLRPQAILLLERSINDPNARSRHEFSYHPGRYLARLYGLAGDRAKARQTILDLLSQQDYSRNGSSNPGYAEYQEIQSLHAAGQDFLKLKLPLEALRMYDRASDPAKFQAASRWGGTYLEREVERGRKSAADALTPEVLAASLQDWVRAPTVAAGENSAQPPSESPVVDFSTSVQPRSADAAMVTSLFETALAAAAGKPVALPVVVAATNPRNQSPVQQAFSAFTSAVERRASQMPASLPTEAQNAVFQQLREQLAEAAKASEDPSISTAELLLQLISNNPSETTLLVSSLANLATHLEQQLPDRASDADHPAISAWIVARRALKHPDREVQSSGDILSTRSIAAARELKDSMWLLAMLRERGQIAADAGDLPTAERHWSEMLDAILKTDQADERPADARPAGAAAPARPVK